MSEATERALLPVASGRRTLHAVGGLLRPRAWRVAAGLAVLVAGVLAGLLVPPLVGRIVDLVVDGRGADSITWPAILLVVAALGEGTLSAAGIAELARAGESALAELRERFLGRALRLPLGQVERAGSGDLTSRVINDVTVIAEAVREAMPAMVRSLITIGLTLGGLAVLDWRFLPAALIAVPVQVHTVRWYVRRAGPLYAAQRVAVGAQQHQLLGTIDGAATVRAFRLTEAHLDRVGGRSRAAVELLLRGIVLQTRFYSRLHIAEYLGLSAVLVAGFMMVRDGTATVGTATAAALYFHGLFGPINMALSLVDDAQAAAAGLTRLVGVADLPEPSRDATAGTPRDASVKVTALNHAYVPGRPVLHDVTLEVPSGERVALVGVSGAGKTTLAKLIAGVHRPSEGSVLVGGVEPAPEAPAPAAVLVTQEVHVFAGTLADDLRLAEPTATDAQVRAALDRVGALDWVERLPDGLDTTVGDGGHALTIAQAQQLAFARVVLADPPVVILDEATAEAGSAGARSLEDSAEAALEGRTALVVAHRLAQAAAADRIVVLDAGRVVESGTHTDLVAARGRYAALWSAWSSRRLHKT
ncbi:ATP-binding cassette, subfamily C [Actinomadura madurae]|uniref:ATP-binding cassette, subfamily C n=1 Tax=Actinomadura madurae TaxID=1993 RepID=A0A1I5GN17_9ACTN|nr:ABC transporter ATP-binding protein [Actinomadura madurae]SFO37236.1 ATP-binding cassette, subfamily C [Actinomadura madurae]